MRLRWTVVEDGDRPSTRDVVVRCPRGTALAAVVDLLPHRRAGTPDGPTPPRRVEVDGQLLAPDVVVGLPPLLDGAVVRLTAGAGRTAPGRGRGPMPVTTAEATGGRAGPQAPSPPAHLLELAVTHGPDAGTVAPLRRGTVTVGRSAANDVRLRDPRLSRAHCVLTVGPDGVLLRDARPPGEGAPTDAPTERLLRLGTRWDVGAGRVQLRAVAHLRTREITVLDTGEGTREVRPPPRTRTPEVVAALPLPAPARPGRAGTFPLLAVVLPALAAGGLAWWTGYAVYLALAAVGPLLVAGSWWTARREARREGALGRRAHARACAAVRTEAAAAATELAAARARSVPHAVALLDACTEVAGPLWQRHHEDDDALRLRLGRAVPPGGGTAEDTLTPRVTTVDHEGGSAVHATDDDLLTVDLRDGHLGLVEAGEDPACARSLVGQLVALLPPTSLTVVPVVAVEAGDAWAWLGLLPHVPDDPRGEEGAAGALRQVLRLLAARVDHRPAGGDPPGGRPPVLVVVDDPSGRLDGGALDGLSGSHRHGVHVLAVARRTERLPRLCAAVLAPSSPDGVEGRLTRTADGASGRAVLDTVAPWWATRLARALAPLRPAAPGDASALPVRAALADLMDLRPEAVRERWAAPRDGLAVPLGVGGDGPVWVDLTTAGPHALVAGTTGAGKSELLRSWLLAMAASRPPDELALLLVDYKGGATFDDLAGLPHCVGLLTDLDGGATGRVLHSLRAEVRRRERLLAAAGARDLTAYRAQRTSAAGPPGSGGPTGPGGPMSPGALPRLLVVVDEFRVLAEDAPDVLGQFVRLAATGRSLGIHLVLATQRPGGVVSPDIRANAGLRIALRVQDAGDSRDVVERPDAAWLPPDAPGRAVVVGAGVDTVLQTAWTGGRGDEPEISVRPAGAEGRGAPGADAAADRVPRSAEVREGAVLVVASVVEAARLAGAGKALPPWLPPLPAFVTRADVLGDRGSAAGDMPGSLLLGMADVPWAQTRAPLRWSPLDDGPLLVLGAARSGRSTTLATVGDAARRAGVAVVRLSGAPGGEDHVVDVLSALVSPPPDAARDAPPDGRGEAHEPRAGVWPRALLLLDDADDLLDPGADPTAADLLLRLLRGGHREGVGVALAGGRALASSRAAGGVGARLVHRTVDRGDALVAGVPTGTAALPPLPGRCHVVGLAAGPGGGAGAEDNGAAAGTGSGPPVLEAQVLLTAAPGAEDRGGDARPPAPGEHLTGPVAPCTDRVPSWVPGALPTRTAATDLPPPHEQVLPLGRVADGGTWDLDVSGAGLVVIAGPPRSGRTTTLRTVHDQALSAGLRVHVGATPRPGSLSGPPGRPPAPRARPTTRTDGPSTPGSGRSTTSRSAGPAGPGSEGPAHLLLVDDVDRCAETELEHLEQWLRTATGPLAAVLDPRATAVVAGASTWFADGFRGLPALARANGRGVVLLPGRTDLRDVLGVRGAPVQQERHPGRGLLVEHGEVRRVQVATVRPRPSARTSPPRRLPSGVEPTGGTTA